ncbi:RidA family protein [Pseudomonas sp. dw_358]|uniref:RidA family protein n=1 Tax=Pseudomonas sp. dw_358 TaxID=2720083 RepID=UPI001BD40DE4|nr:RidA family protein [Pseudomonas sp. dw_358]
MTAANTHLRGPFAWAQDMEYSQSVAANGLLFISGQFGADASGEVVPGGAETQIRATFENLQTVLAASGASLADLVSLRCYLLNGEDYPILKRVRREFIPVEPFPTSVVICVPAFAFAGMLVEIEAVARLAQ